VFRSRTLREGAAAFAEKRKRLDRASSGFEDEHRHRRRLEQLAVRIRLAALPVETTSSAPSEDILERNLEAAAHDIRARSWMGFNPAFSKKLAARGWVGATTPRKYGGANLDAFSRFVLVEELLAAGAPVSAHWIADRQSGPLILKFGTEAQRRFYLPRICAAEAFFCIGMSEPNTGSDLAGVGTRCHALRGRLALERPARSGRPTRIIATT